MGEITMSEEEKKKNGRPKLKIDKDLVEKLALIHCTPQEIGYIVGAHPDTIRKRFSAELAKGKAEGKRKLRRKQFEVALQGNPTMLVWLGKNLLGQSDSPLGADDTKALPWTDDLD
jgi:hypothetical protein